MNRLKSKLGSLLKTRWRAIAAVFALAGLGYVIHQGSKSPFVHHITVLGPLRNFSEKIDAPEYRDHDDAFADPGTIGENGGSHVTWLHKEGGKVRLVVDGVLGPPFDSIDPMGVQLSPDERHLAYTGKIGDKTQVVIDGQSGPLFDQVVFDGQDRQVFDQVAGGELHTIYRAKAGDQWVIVLDGQARPQPKNEFQFSPDYKHIAIVNIVNGQYQIILDGKPGPFFDLHYVNQIPVDVDKPKFSPDSQHLAYVVQKRSNGQMTGEQVILDGQPGPWFDYISSDLKFTADSQHLVYTVHKDADKEQMVMDGKLGPEYDVVLWYYTFSPTGAHFAYMGVAGDKQQIVADGVPGPWFDRIIWWPQYGKDGRLAYVGITGGKSQIVLDGQPGPLYDEIGTYAFSPDGKHLAYEACEGANWRVVVDGVQGPAFDRIGEKELAQPTGDGFELAPSHVFFSNNSKHVGYVAKSGDKYHVVVDGAAGPPFDLIYGFTDSRWYIDFYGFMREGFFEEEGLSPDGRQTAYFGHNNERTAWQSFLMWLGSPFARSSADDDRGITQLVVDGFVVRNSVEGSVTPGSPVDDLVFSPDSQDYAYKAQDAGDGLWRVYVDNVPGPTFKKILVGPLWQKDGPLEYLAVQEKGTNDEVVRVVVSGL